jgi:hypothetical protein
MQRHARGEKERTIAIEQQHNVAAGAGAYPSQGGGAGVSPSDVKKRCTVTASPGAFLSP